MFVDRTTAAGPKASLSGRLGAPRFLGERQRLRARPSYRPRGRARDVKGQWVTGAGPIAPSGPVGVVCVSKPMSVGVGPQAVQEMAAAEVRVSAAGAGLGAAPPASDPRRGVSALRPAAQTPGPVWRRARVRGRTGLGHWGLILIKAPPVHGFSGPASVFLCK